MELREKKAVLILENGSVTEGKSFGSEGSVIGEVVFSTSMTGYQEALTDPAYYGQILIQTFPLIGNYGVNDEDKEAEKPAIQGYIVREYCEKPSNFRMAGELDDFLKKNSIIGLYDIDTRKLTRELCEHGSMNGMITTEDYDLDSVLKELKEYKIKDAVKTVSGEKTEEFKTENSKYNTVLVNFGCKRSFIKEFTSRLCNVTVLSYNAGVDEILKYNPDGIILSGGPGNPAELDASVQTIKNLFDKKIPILGVGLGHQLTAIAAGGKVTKLTKGHRGGNQPVIDVKSGKTYITSQNHGYTVEGDSVKIAEVNRINANDKSCEGLKYKEYPVITVEFYPETLKIINDTSYIFEEFISMMEQKN